jgi:hypothetical protein
MPSNHSLFSLPGRRLGLIALVLVLLLSASSVSAQTTISTGSIQGTITDQSSAVMSGAKVTISNKDTGQVIELTTSSAGTYSSGALLPGTYVVRVEQKGFRTAEVRIVVSVGVTSPGNIKLQVGQEAQVIEVTGTVVQVNTEQPTVQGVLTSQQIDSLPISGRNFLDLAQLEPGVQIQDGGNFDPTKNGFSSISFGGRYGRTARIELDGIDVSDETVGTTTQNISAGAIGEFQLSQSTLDLSTELTSSGAVNVVTKSGTNTLHGEGFYLFRDKSMMANFPGGQDTYYQRNHYGGSLGGFFIKDKLFFFANGERIKQGLSVPLAPPTPFENLPSTYPGGFKDTMSMGKLDYRIKPDATFFYRFTYERNGDTRAYGSTYQPFLNKDNTPAHGIGLDFRTGEFTHSIRFGYLKFSNRIADAVTGNPGIYNPGAPAGIAIRIGPAGVVTRFGPSRLAPQATLQTDHQIKYDGSRLVGAHILRYGISYNAIRGGGYAAFYGIAPEARAQNDDAAQLIADSGPYPALGPEGGRTNPLNYEISRILLSNGQGFFTEKAAFGYPAGGQWDDRLGAYFGDSWKIKPNFTLTYGVRWSRDTGRADGDLPAMTCNQIDAANFTVDDVSYVPCTGSQLILDQFGQAGIGGRVRQPNTNFGPQVGFAWDPRKNGKTVIRAGAGIYYENAVFNNVLFDRPPRLAQGLFWGTASPCPSGRLGLPGVGTVTTVDGVDIATGVCGQRIGDVMNLVADLQKMFQHATSAAGAQLNGNFLGEVLASGDSSTGNGFIAPNYRTPRSIQMNIGIQHEIRPGTVLTADFIRNVGLRYLLTYDTNHVGDARYLNLAAAQNAITSTLAWCGVTTIDQGIAGCPNNLDENDQPIPLFIGDFAGFGLDSGKSYLAGTPASLNGLTPDTGAAFAGINPLVGENEMLFPSGRSVYTGLQMKLVQNVANPLPGLQHASLQVSYALSRFNTMAADQDFIPYAWDYRQPGRYFGPGSLDRKHQISFGGTFDLLHGPRLSFVSHFFSPLPQDLSIQNQTRGGEIFFTDVIGDGSPFAHVVPGQQLGSWGRSVLPGNINKMVNNYNNTVGGTFLPAAKALLNAGLFTSDQLTQLGAVADYLALAPQDQMAMSWAHGFDFKLSWPIKIGGEKGWKIEPSVGFYNLFNFANFNGASNYMLGELATCSTKPATPADCPGSSGSATGTALSDLPTKDSLRVGAGTGVNTAGAPRQIEWGLKFTF